VQVAPVESKTPTPADSDQVNGPTVFVTSVPCEQFPFGPVVALLHATAVRVELAGVPFTGVGLFVTQWAKSVAPLTISTRSTLE
jgi:hypothetical protein